ncbi:MAG: HAD family hydrolase [Deltaproteobacteria bacterium]|nr:HAD family hydrolase [Deltaproteobacteria bacterium]
MAKNRAVFLDRDGTINEDVGYLNSLSKLRLFPETPQAIKEIRDAGLKAIVITNQSGVARGYFTEAFVEETHRRIQELLKMEGTCIDAFYYCPHHATEGRGDYLQACECRKPKTGMLLAAARDFDIDLYRSYMVGDMMTDMETAYNIPMKGVLVPTGHCAVDKNCRPETPPIKPSYSATDILDAVRWIIKDSHP